MKQLLNTFHRDFDLLLGKYLPVKPAFLKMGQSRPLFVYFRLFYMSQFKYNLKNRGWCAWESNPGGGAWKAQMNPRRHPLAATLTTY